ncbi:MAG: hypothetical protein HY390_07430 [Deltaproteobacteria bacterium]|nr:hypothetical protein [Deltaproteobacteria bacterium]
MTRIYVGALCIALSAAFSLISYEFLRSASTALFTAHFGTNNLPWVMAIIPVGVMILIYMYGWVLSHIGPRKTLLVSSLFSAVSVLIAYVGLEKQFYYGSAFLYVFRQAYIVILIEQYWSFLNSTLTQPQAKKMNGPIAGLSGIGAILGGLGVGHFAELVGTTHLVAISGCLLFPALIFSDIAYHLCGEPKPQPSEKGGHQGHLHLSLFKQFPLLTFLLFVVVLTQILSTFLELTFQNTLAQSIHSVDQQAAYMGNFYAKVNSVAAFFQFVGAPLILNLFPLTWIHIGIPCVHVVSTLYLIQSSTLEMASLSFLLFKSIDYSIFRSAKEILYIPFSFDVRYRAKEVIDVVGYRAGKGFISLVIAGIQTTGFLLTPFFSWGSWITASLWLACMVPIIKKWKSR